MLHSETRILTTHAGSLPRTPELVELLVRHSRREAVDPAALEAATEQATRRVVEQQLAAGIDAGNNGEQSRESFFTYLQETSPNDPLHIPIELMADGAVLLSGRGSRYIRFPTMKLGAR